VTKEDARGKFIKAKVEVKGIGTLTVPKETEAKRSHPLEAEEA
jgi:hypothetical protein